jgi:hypothetical protein
MTGDYPRFTATYAQEDLVEHFLLTPAERTLIDTCRGEVHRHAVAVLLKAGSYLGYCPDDLRQVPSATKTFLAHQLGLLWDRTADDAWRSGTHDAHLVLMHQHTRYRLPTGQDKHALAPWLRTA